jgi:Acyl-CoA carboxylase epsilon subunit
MTALGEETVPVLTVVHGKPTPAELAAVVAVLLAARGAGRTGGSATDAARRSLWAEHAPVRNQLPRPGPGAWRASALPR